MPPGAPAAPPPARGCFATPGPNPGGAARPAAGGCGARDGAPAGRPPAAGCRACGLKGAAAAPGLRFPWGPVPVEPGTSLLIGRENSPIAGQLAAYSNISRRHARVHADGTSLTVEDLDSTNGTFVNGEKVPPRTPVPAKAGDRVRFAATVEATVLGEPS